MIETPLKYETTPRRVLKHYLFRNSPEPTYDPLLLAFEIKYPWRSGRCDFWDGYRKTFLSAWRRKSVPAWKAWRWHIRLLPWWKPEPVLDYCCRCGRAFAEEAAKSDPVMTPEERAAEACKWAGLEAALSEKSREVRDEHGMLIGYTPGRLPSEDGDYEGPRTRQWSRFAMVDIGPVSDDVQPVADASAEGDLPTLYRSDAAAGSESDVVQEPRTRKNRKAKSLISQGV